MKNNSYYHEAVKNSQLKLSKQLEAALRRDLSHYRYHLRDIIYKLPCIRIIVIEELESVNSIASVTDDFNSNKKGNNAKVTKRVINTLKSIEESPIIYDKSEWPIWISDVAGKLHDCNFKEVWVQQILYPRVEQWYYTHSMILKFRKIKTEFEETLEKIREIENTLVKSALKAAVKIAINLNSSLDEEDAIQIANTALVEAVRKFNPDSPVKFITYAYNKMKFAMKQVYISDPDGIVKIPNHVKGVEITGWIGLDEGIDVGRYHTLSDILPDDKMPVDEEVGLKKLNETLKKTLLRYLPDSEFEVLYTRYLKEGRTLTYQEVSDMLGKNLTRERIRQIEESALERLQDIPKLKNLLVHIK